MISDKQQLLRLLDRSLEECCSDNHRQELNQLLRTHPELVALYCDYMAIHGSLHWDAGQTASSEKVLQAIPSAMQISDSKTASRMRNPILLWTASSLAIACLVTFLSWQWANPKQKPVNVVKDEARIQNDEERLDEELRFAENNGAKPGTNVQVEDRGDPLPDSTDLKPLNTQIAATGSTQRTDPSERTKPGEHKDHPETAPAVAEYQPHFGNQFSDADVVQTIDRLLEESWKEQDVQPSVSADDSEWVRRAYLVYAGRIPSFKEVEAFQKLPKDARRSTLIELLTTSPQHSQYVADVWTRLLIGRTERPGVNRFKLQEYLVSQFEGDKPWIETVTELITARGRNDRNGATNFLLAHLNNQATPATAVTARLFLGQQISCVQCHDHPFAQSFRQEDYWALNAFFKDTQKVSLPIADASKKKAMGGVPWKLEDRFDDPQSKNGSPKKDRSAEDRMTYFENRQGLKIAVLPSYDGTTLDHRSTENRRDALAKLLVSDSRATVARAMVNRTWSHFFGYGFTNPIDDMGPHVAVSHPELLGALTEAFVKSNYSLKRLMKWIALSNAWQNSSMEPASTTVDSPEVGDAPLFSRVYARRMSPEQVYESIRVAIQSVSSQPISNRKDNAVHRRDWVRQFATSYGTDENDEAVHFGGTISQAMVMMNGSEIDDAIQAASVAIVKEKKGANSRTLEQMSMSLLSREPTERERKAFRRHVTQLTRQHGPSGQVIAAQDMLWAYLNSTEFMTVH